MSLCESVLNESLLMMSLNCEIDYDNSACVICQIFNYVNDASSQSFFDMNNRHPHYIYVMFSNF